MIWKTSLKCYYKQVIYVLQLWCIILYAHYVHYIVLVLFPFQYFFEFDGA